MIAADRIYGDEFEYDQKAGLAGSPGHRGGPHRSAVGEYALAAGVPAKVTGPAASARVMHVTTSGLVYLQKLGVAATSEPIAFQSGTTTGHASGRRLCERFRASLMLHSGGDG